jgi:L-asparaginase
MRFALLEMGGTINGILDPQAPAPTGSRVAAWLAQQTQRLSLQFSLSIVVMKDSRALTDADRQALATAIEQCPEDRILVPHGTYTMPATGQFLQRHLGPAAAAKRIVLVGSLLPLEVTGSDAPESLEFALTTLEGEGPGVFVAMSGRVWDPAEVIKDPASGAFIPRNS